MRFEESKPSTILIHITLFVSTLLFISSISLFLSLSLPQGFTLEFDRSRKSMSVYATGPDGNGRMYCKVGRGR